jgi:hypothetical protein
VVRCMYRDLDNMIVAAQIDDLPDTPVGRDLTVGRTAFGLPPFWVEAPVTFSPAAAFS